MGIVIVLLTFLRRRKRSILDYGTVPWMAMVWCFERFFNLKQGGNLIQRYIAEKKALAQRLDPPMPDKYVMFLFISGLRSDIQEEMWASKQTTSTAEAEKLTVRIAAEKKKSATIGNIVTQGPTKRKKTPAASSSGNDPKRSAAFEEFKKMKSKCFGCGKPGYRKEDCKASAEEKGQHKQNKFLKKN
jgi:hypothetical protein